MPIYKSTFFQESALAHELLDGLTGLEVGGGLHNAFGLDTLNVDRVPVDHPDFAPYASEQIRLGNMKEPGSGKVMPVDIVAPGDCIPVADQSFDFVISSHVIEHFYDPISAIREWMRISTKYIFIICPLRDALESDKDKPLTGLEEHIMRFKRNQYFSNALKGLKPKKGVVLPKNLADGIEVKHTDEHHSRWTVRSFVDMCFWIFEQEWGKGWMVCNEEMPDKKVGNGFTVVLKKTDA